MRVRLDRIVITDFKRIATLTVELSPITALVGGNTSGRSSALQAAQLEAVMDLDAGVIHPLLDEHLPQAVSV